MTDQFLSSSVPDAASTPRPIADDVCTALVIELADRTNADVTTLPPLYETVDPDALDRLVTTGDDDLEVSFDYVGRRITVRGTGDFEIERRDDEK